MTEYGKIYGKGMNAEWQRYERGSLIGFVHVPATIIHWSLIC